MFFADFKNANSNMRNVLFQKYCTSFYGSQILPLYSSDIEAVYCAWRKAIRKVWRVPYNTHCNILPYLANCMNIDLLFAIRSIKFIDRMCKSENDVVSTITHMGILGSHCIIGANKRHLMFKHNFDVNTVSLYWKESFLESLHRSRNSVKLETVVRIPS